MELKEYINAIRTNIDSRNFKELYNLDMNNNFGFYYRGDLNTMVNFYESKNPEWKEEDERNRAIGVYNYYNNRNHGQVSLENIGDYHKSRTNGRVNRKIHKIKFPDGKKHLLNQYGMFFCVCARKLDPSDKWSEEAITMGELVCELGDFVLKNKIPLYLFGTSRQTTNVFHYPKK